MVLNWGEEVRVCVISIWFCCIGVGTTVFILVS